MRKRTMEDYLEQLYNLQKKEKPVHTNDIANVLKLNPASVTEFLQKLNKEGYINYEKYGGATLTEKGEKIAVSTIEKHDTLKKFLKIFGIDDKIANIDACKIEHVVNNETMKRLTKFVEFVHKYKDAPIWLDHFNYFYKTGKYIECTPRNSEKCPIHRQNTN
jgi:DtxR family Mn-dependent transcriptional regulator